MGDADEEDIGLVPDGLGSPKGLPIEEQVAWACHCDHPLLGQPLVDDARLTRALEHESRGQVV